MKYPKSINLFFLATISLFIMAYSKQEVINLKSPDSKIQLRIRNQNEKINYEISFNDQLLIVPSNLGLTSSLGDLSRGKITGFKQSEKNEQWKPLFGKKNSNTNHYKELSISVQSENSLGMNIIFRAFNDGIAFRYEIPAQKNIDSLTITADKTEFLFSRNFICRAIEKNIEQSEFEPKRMSQVKFSKLPMLVKTHDAWMAINEASIFDFSMMYLVNPLLENGMQADIGVSSCSLPLKTPWRVIQFGKKAGDLIESNILVNLNEPCQIEDPSWIKPGKSMWDWRNQGDSINGFVYNCNEASYQRLIDFASTNSMNYVLFDADWYSDKGPIFPRKDLNMPAIIDYAKNKSIKVLLYIDRHRKNTDNGWKLEEVLKTFNDWGVAGIKYGFLANEIIDRKAFVDSTRSITRLCAKYKLLINFHDNPVPPGGEERTWPNRISVEYCHAQQDSRKSFGPGMAVTVPFINGISGPLDMANGFYDLNGLQNRSKVDKSGLNSTVVGETARCLVNYSPLLVLPDNGDVYMQKTDLFDFIRRMPDTWDETRVIAGEPGKFIVVARRSGNDWFVGGNTNEDSRLIDIKLDFLNEGKYNITTYLDAPSSHYLSNKEDYVIKTFYGDKASQIKAKMAPGGGVCIKLIAN